MLLPGSIILAFGLTQYNFGAVVLTLNANGVLEVLVNDKYSEVGLVKLPIFVWLVIWPVMDLMFQEQLRCL